MKKFLGILLVTVLLAQSFAVPDVAHAETLGSLKQELINKQNELNNNNNQKTMTEAEIIKTKNEIVSIENSIAQTYTDMANLDKEIEQLNKNIKEKDKEMKDIMNFVQVSNGESAYLEYAFGAQDFTDFIYRTAVAEQMTKYNDQLIKEFNQSIEDSKKKQEQLRVKQGEMAEQQKQLEQKKSSLGETLSSLKETGIGIADFIEYQKEIINLYVSKGCKDNEDILTCGRKVLPAGTAFYRPTEVGRISSEWGARDLLGRSWHEGIDTAVSVGTTVYAVGTGMVANVVSYSCGGNMVIVHHNINNRTYTSVYVHLSSVSVSKGMTVNRNTIIGFSGGTAGGYDTCTTGPHFHLTIATGLFGVDYDDWLYELNKKYSINPRSVINYPGYWVPWNDRITAY